MKYYIYSHNFQTGLLKNVKELIRKYTRRDGEVVTEHYLSDYNGWSKHPAKRNTLKYKEININQVDFYIAIMEWPYYEDSLQHSPLSQVANGQPYPSYVLHPTHPAYNDSKK